VAKLLFTTSAFQSAGRTVQRVPILLDRNMRLVEPACRWLLYLALIRGQTRSPETWRTYGEALYDWWQTLEANDWQWDEVTALELSAYRDHMLSQRSEHTSRPYARSTVNARLRALGLFYRWCAVEGLVRRSPFTASELRVRGRQSVAELTHGRPGLRSRQGSEITVRNAPTLPRPLPVELLQTVMSQLGVRDRLIVEWSLMTGMRRMEIAAMDVSTIRSARSTRLLTCVKLCTTKGNKPRRVYPPLPLLDRTRAYMREERGVAVKAARTRDSRYLEPSTVFLTQSASPMTPRRVGAMFSVAARRAGVGTSFHALRHTFATTMLQLLQREALHTPELNPLLTLQALMGHSDISTTAIYLRVLGTDLDAVERSVDELYSALLR